MKTRILAVLLAVLLSATSCLKTDNQATGTGDALIVVKKKGETTVYGVSLYAYTFSEFKSVSVTAAKNGTSKTYTLAANQGYKTSFYYESPDAEFSPELPQATDYIFTAQFENGTAQTFSDVLTDEVLAVPTIIKMEYDSVKNILTVNWNEVPNADSYAINITDGQTVLFSSVELPKTVKYFSISPSGSGWNMSTPPVSGKTYTLKLYAFLYETTANAYNVQCTSVAETSLVWGTPLND